MNKLFYFLLSIPKRYCLIKWSETQCFANYQFGKFYLYPESLGYARGEMAEAIANFWLAVADALPGQNMQ